MTVSTARIVSPLDAWHRVHNYYKGSPFHPDGRQVLSFRFKGLDGEGQVCLIDRETSAETVLAQAAVHSYHTGANAYFCDGGNKVIYREAAGRTAVCDIHTGEIVRFEGTHCNYTGRIEQRFLEVDPPCDTLEEQGRMGIYVRHIDGSNKRLLVTVDDLLRAHPLGKAIRQAEIRFRLGAEICPDQKRARLGLLTRHGPLLKDNFICHLDGDPRLEFHGKLGSHPGHHANNRDILTFVKPWNTILGEAREIFGADGEKFGLLGSYNTQTHVLRILSDFRIAGGTHNCPSPVGDLVVLDALEEKACRILLFDEAEGVMRVIHAESWQRPEQELRRRLIRAGDPAEKRYDVSAHPAFSQDGKRILFNSCADGIIQLKEIEVG